MGLLTLSQQNTFKTIRSNWAKTKKESTTDSNFAKLQQEVENNEMKKLLGGALLLDIQKNPEDPKYKLLLDGSEFEDCNGNTNKFEGIRYQLAYFNYAQYLPESSVSDTYTGFVQKDRQETQNVSAGVMKNQQQRWRELALNDFQVMKDFLHENSTTYPLWNCTKKRKIFTPRIITIRKTQR